MKKCDEKQDNSKLKGGSDSMVILKMRAGMPG